MSNKSLLQMMTPNGESQPQAADDLARVVVSILKRLRKGEVVALPGLGRLVPGPKSSFFLEKLPKAGTRGRR
jgi:hypothetical protein